MRQLDISNYQVEVETPEGKKSLPYNMKDSLADIILNPRLNLNGSAALRNNMLAQKILTAESDTILLEEAEYERIKGVCEIITGFGRNEIPLLQRIMEAPEVQVKEDTQVKESKEA